MSKLLDFLKLKAYNIRVNSILSTTQAGSGHPTSALSSADIVAALFFDVMNYDPKNKFNPNNDRFILSKGHAVPVLYSAYKELGVLSEKKLMTLRQIDSVLEGHPTPRFEYTEAATGSLGQGLSIGAGIALSAKMDKRDFLTYVLMGDSEISEGSVWEALELAAYYKLNNLVGIVDCNGLGQANEPMDDHNCSKYVKKFSAFGWNAIEVDGHNIKDLIKVFEKAKKSKDKPSVIIAKTVKGYGVSSVAGKMGYHGKPFKKEDLPEVFAELKTKFKDVKEVSYDWQSKIPEIKEEFVSCGNVRIVDPEYEIGQKIATRKAYGQALVAVGKACHNILSLDAEVKNSTYAQDFEKVFPERFVECFIAEQNMIGMAVGLTSRGKITFSSTFAAFLTRAFDQIRMASIGRVPLRLVGSHAGVSIGEDGPSQMGLEDIAMMRAVFDSFVFYPSDAVSTYKILEIMSNCDKNISYLRTTRMDTPVIYKNNEEFKIGGCKVLKESDSDKACIVGAGITLYESLKAYEMLKKKGISVAVIDLYSVKPFDKETILKLSKKSNQNLIIVEDHYQEGGIGEMIKAELFGNSLNIKHLFVDKLPRSGSPEDLLAFESINADSIIKVVKSL